MALSLAVGVGVTVFPFAFQDMRASSYTANFWRCTNCNDTIRGLRNGVSIFLSTGYCIGTVLAILLNFILPEDPPVIGDDEEEEGEEDLKLAIEEGAVEKEETAVKKVDAEEEVEA